MKKIKSVILPAYNRNIIRAIIGLETGERKLPALQPNDVLIKMEAAPINPSDIAFIRGEYNVDKQVPAVPGFEGVGIVEDANPIVQGLIGKRVSCFVQGDNDGTWAEYFITNADNCIVIKDELAIEQAACLSINPFTAYALFEIAKEKGCDSIVQNAASGQVAEFVRVFAKMEGVKVINIVRKQEQVEDLKSAGEEIVLNSTEEGFAKQLKELSQELKASIAFDAVGGEITGMLINNMPAGSDVILYGGLSGLDIAGIDSLGIIFGNKKLYGFDLNKWIAVKKGDEFQKVANEIQNMIIAGDLTTEIQSSFSLDDVVSAIRIYIKSMSAGKVLLHG